MPQLGSLLRPNPPGEQGCFHLGVPRAVGGRVEPTAARRALGGLVGGRVAAAGRWVGLPYRRALGRVALGWRPNAAREPEQHRLSRRALCLGVARSTTRRASSRAELWDYLYALHTHTGHGALAASAIAGGMALTLTLALALALALTLALALALALALTLTQP